MHDAKWRRWAPGLLLTLALCGPALADGAAAGGADSRQAVPLGPPAQAHFLREMRAMLAVTQQVLAAALRDDMPAVARAARRMGMAAQRDVPAEIVRSMPPAMRRLGRATHQGFDRLALDAEQLGDRGQVLESLAALMERCVACHAAYRLERVPAPRRPDSAAQGGARDQEAQ